VQAGRLVSIEQALAELGGAPPRPAAPPLVSKVESPAPVRGPSPFALDRAKKAAVEIASPEPISGAEWKERLHATLMEIGMAFTADAVEHSAIEASAGELAFTTPEEFMLGMKADDLNQAVRKILGRPMKIKIVASQGMVAPPPQIRKSPPADETTARALANPGVKQFQEAFPGGQIRTVRNLKE
jgi:hypothetical protein